MTSAALVLALLAALGGTRQTPASRRAGSRGAVFTATEYAFQGPATLPAGSTTLQLVNRGRAAHQGQLVRVAAGHTAAEAVRALAAGESADWLLPAGGFGPVAPGGTARLTLPLAAGSYLLYCALPGADGVADAGKGMITTFTVSQGGAASADTGSAVALLTVSDRGFRFQRILRVGGEDQPMEGRLMPSPLASGTRIIELQNFGPTAHEIQVVRAESPRTVREFVAWLYGGQRGPAPARQFGGVATLPPGMKVRLQVVLAPGAYWVFCTIRHRSVSRGFEVGELTEFVVR